jgi:hypothetical protein
VVTDLIVYAHPIGELAAQLEQYFETSRERFGANAAHKHPVHCSLTGFFHDDIASVPIYIDALRSTLADHHDRSGSDLVPSVDQLRLEGDWFGLELSSAPLVVMMETFAARQPTLARIDELRVKTWLHVSIAYEFNSEHAVELAALAQTTINAGSQVDDWHLGLWERSPGNQWHCHWSTPIPG